MIWRDREKERLEAPSDPKKRLEVILQRAREVYLDTED